MQNIPMQDGHIIKVVGYLISCVGVIIGFCGLLVGYIYVTDRKQDKSEHKNLFSKTDNHESRISKIEGKFKL